MRFTVADQLCCESVSGGSYLKCVCVCVCVFSGFWQGCQVRMKVCVWARHRQTPGDAQAPPLIPSDLKSLLQDFFLSKSDFNILLLNYFNILL